MFKPYLDRKIAVGFFASFDLMFLRTVILLGLMAVVFPAHALETEPHPLDTFLTGILNFQDPTGIRGTLRYIDKEEQGIWLNWEQRSDDGPLFETGWKLVPGDSTLLVYPDSPAQFEKLEHISKGTPIEMIIQMGKEGRRRILSYQDLSLPREIPL
jgi:hypothetical protein